MPFNCVTGDEFFVLLTDKAQVLVAFCVGLHVVFWRKIIRRSDAHLFRKFLVDEAFYRVIMLLIPMYGIKCCKFAL